MEIWMQVEKFPEDEIHHVLLKMLMKIHKDAHDSVICDSVSECRL